MSHFLAMSSMSPYSATAQGNWDFMDKGGSSKGMDTVDIVSPPR